MTSERARDESAPLRPPLELKDCRISARRSTARWTDDTVDVADAMDFWAFTAGAANVVTQLARPAVGYGVVESKVDSGNLLKHPWKRARTTFQYLAVAVMGTDDDRAAFRAAVDGAHRHVKSEPTSPVRYNAFDRELQMWVAACLFVGLEDRILPVRRRRRGGGPIPGRPHRSQDGQSASAAAISVIADVPQHRVPCAGVPGRAAPSVGSGAAIPLRTVVPDGRLREPIPAAVRASGRHLRSARRRASTGPIEPKAGVRRDDP